MTDSLKKGDSVSWNTSQGKTKGKVVKKLTSKETIEVGSGKKRAVKASKDQPKVVVKSEKSGKQAVHDAKSLKKQ